MSKVFEQFHLSLIERDQPDLLVTPKSREIWLNDRFADSFTFWHQGKDFYWVPKGWSTDFITGIIERKRSKTQHASPEEGAEEFVGEEWQGSIVIIDPTHRTDGQKLSFELDASVGQPSAILASMVAKLNEDVASQYALHFKPLIAEGTFARFAEKHGGNLQYVSFKFNVPNMILGLATKTEDGLKRLGKETGAQEVELKLESDDGVKASSEAVTEAVAYAEKGNARITAKAKNGDYWTSTKQKVSVKLHEAIDFAKAKKDDVREWFTKALDRESEAGDPGDGTVNRGASRD